MIPASSMVALLGKFLTKIEDLEGDFNAAKFDQRISEMREKYPIVVIDDKDFTPAQNLRNYRFQITHFRDFQNLDSLTKFPIILCDLQGVGMSLSPDLQGAEVIREIKKDYPEKYVVAYTSQGSSETTEVARSFADSFLKKDANPEEWRDLLDKAISEVSNPIEVWKKARIRLLDVGVTPLQVALLEDIFAKSAKSNPQQYKTALQNGVDKFDIPSSAKSIIESLIASIIFSSAAA